MKIEIREERENEYFETEAMVRRSFYNKFAPGCDEHLMVHVMRTHPLFMKEFSRVAVIDGEIAGVIMYFMSKIIVGEQEIQVPSFGPLCVEHRYKNHGIGGKLLTETLALVKEAGYPGVLIMGEPEYYPRFGFERAGTFGLTDAQGNVFDAFMGIEFEEGSLHYPGGRFMEPEDLCSFSEKDVEEFDKQFEPMLKSIRPCQWPYEDANEEENGYHLVLARQCPKQFEELFADYISELSMEDSALNTIPIEELLGEIWDDVKVTAYVIMVKEELAGLFVSSVPDANEQDDDSKSYLQEMFVLPQFRHRGIAKDIFLRFIRQQTDNTGFCMVPEGKAGKYWVRLLQENDFTYEIYPEDEERVYCKITTKK